MVPQGAAQGYVHEAQERVTADEVVRELQHL